MMASRSSSSTASSIVSTASCGLSPPVGAMPSSGMSAGSTISCRAELGATSRSSSRTNARPRGRRSPGSRRPRRRPGARRRRRSPRAPRRRRARGSTADGQGGPVDRPVPVARSWRLTMSSTLVSSTSTSSFSNTMSTPAMASRVASSSSTSRRCSSATRSINGSPTASRSPGGSRSINPSTSSASSAARNCEPSLLGRRRAALARCHR